MVESDPQRVTELELPPPLSSSIADLGTEILLVDRKTGRLIRRIERAVPIPLYKEP